MSQPEPAPPLASQPGLAVAAHGARIVHAELPIVPSPSRLPSQHIVTAAVGATAHFVGQQWLQPGQRVLRHTHPCEESLTFLAGEGEATLGEETVPIGAGVSIFIPPGVVHGFRATGDETLHVIVVFPVPYFAETALIDPLPASAAEREAAS